MRISDWSSDVCSSDLSYHHGKHHNAYVTKANELIPQAGLQGASLSQAIKAAKEQGKAGLFNQVGQVWNHSFYWLCVSPEKQAPTGKLLELINESYGSVDDSLARFKAEAVGLFASGWAWLVLKDGKLDITSLHDGDAHVAYGGMKPRVTR